MGSIERPTAEQVLADLDGLVLLLQDGVASGASIGFLAPLGADDARA